MRQKLAQFLTQDVNTTPDKPVQIEKPTVSRREALDILKITIEEYQDLVRRRLDKPVEEKKVVTPAKLEGPLEDFFQEVRKAYKKRKLVDKNKFKFIDSYSHLMELVENDYIVSMSQEDNAVTLFYSWYVKKYGVKKHQEAVVK